MLFRLTSARHRIRHENDTRRRSVGGSPARVSGLRPASAALLGNTSNVESGYWASADGQIYAEHGHQISQRANRFAAWPSPFLEDGGREHLERPWGEQTVTAFYVEQEARFPVIDNVADRGAGLRYGLSASGIADIGDRAEAFLRYVLFRMPWSQFRVDLDAGDVQTPRWDVAAIRAQGPTFLSESLPDDDQFKRFAVAGLEAGRLAELMSELTAPDITAICDYRAAVRRSHGGAWQRTVTPVQLEALKQAHMLTDTELLEMLQPEHLAPCYSFVQIEPYTETPGLPVIRYWRHPPEGWEMAAACDILPWSLRAGVDRCQSRSR